MLVGTFVIVALLSGSAAALTAHLLTHPSLQFATPGPDRRIGTPDDVVVTGATMLGPQDSGQNTHSAASFAYLIGSNVSNFPDDSTYDYILFVDGDIEFAPNLAASTASDVQLDITGGTLRSTTEFMFHGGMRGEAQTPVAGVVHLDPMTGAGTFTLSGHFSPAEVGADFVLMSQTLSGTTTILLADKFGKIADPYLDQLVVLLPSNATALILAEVTGHVTEATHQGWPSRGVLVAYTTDALGCVSFLTGVPCSGGGGNCASFSECEPPLTAALPPVAGAPKKNKPTAKRLKALATSAHGNFGKATGASGKKQARFYKKACTALKTLASVAGKANGKGRLGVDLGAIQAAVAKLRSFIPGC
jgi:hypothetical protein